MKKILIILTIIALIAGVSIFAFKTYKEKESDNNNVKKEEKNIAKEEEDNVLLTIYTDPLSSEYKVLGTQYEYLDQTELEGDLIKFISNKDGVKVRLQYIVWNTDLKCFMSYDEAFDISTKSGEIYAFNGIMAETIPSFRLIAEYKNMTYIWYLQQDGKDGKTVQTIESKNSWVAQDIYEDSNMIPICTALAVSARIYGDDYKNYTSEEFWETIASALTMTYTEHEDEYIIIEEWVLNAFIKTIFPDIEEAPKPPKDTTLMEEIENGIWSIRTCSYGDWISYELIGIYKDDNNTWIMTVAVRNNDEDEEDISYCKVVYLEQNEKQGEGPFEYHVTVVDDLYGV